MMINVDVGLNESYDSCLIEVVELVNAGPGGESDLVTYSRIGGEDRVVIASNDLSQLLDQCFTLIIGQGAVVLNDNTAVL